MESLAQQQYAQEQHETDASFPANHRGHNRHAVLHQALQPVGYGSQFQHSRTQGLQIKQKRTGGLNHPARSPQASISTDHAQSLNALDPAHRSTQRRANQSHPAPHNTESYASHQAPGAYSGVAPAQNQLHPGQHGRYQNLHVSGLLQSGATDTVNGQQFGASPPGKQAHYLEIHLHSHDSNTAVAGHGNSTSQPQVAIHVPASPIQHHASGHDASAQYHPPYPSQNVSHYTSQKPYSGTGVSFPVHQLQYPQFQEERVRTDTSEDFSEGEVLSTPSSSSESDFGGSAYAAVEAVAMSGGTMHEQGLPHTTLVTERVANAAPKSNSEPTKSLPVGHIRTPHMQAQLAQDRHVANPRVSKRDDQGQQKAKKEAVEPNQQHDWKSRRPPAENAREADAKGESREHQVGGDTSQGQSDGSHCREGGGKDTREPHQVATNSDTVGQSVPHPSTGQSNSGRTGNWPSASLNVSLNPEVEEFMESSIQPPLSSASGWQSRRISIKDDSHKTAEQQGKPVQRNRNRSHTTNNTVTGAKIPGQQTRQRFRTHPQPSSHLGASQRKPNGKRDVLLSSGTAPETANKDPQPSLHQKASAIFTQKKENSSTLHTLAPAEVAGDAMSRTSRGKGVSILGTPVRGSSEAESVVANSEDAGDLTLAPTEDTRLTIAHPKTEEEQVEDGKDTRLTAAHSKTKKEQVEDGEDTRSTIAHFKIEKEQVKDGEDTRSTIAHFKTEKEQVEDGETCI